ncbi:hypothetical protein D4764_03G0006140 [Takifugu flavidus]|uniref:Brinker DNA-binding domain-containing protein n=1 Tax=Takifugu flavidus TaxID=433684 RepID=A0A5C6N8M9_9TELE|nr:hypothetical protein D4764_03G0006140 [Takifugu flavidus]
MAPCKRYTYHAELKLKAISHAVEHGNRAAAREFNVNESMVRKWRKQQDDLRQQPDGRGEEAVHVAGGPGDIQVLDGWKPAADHFLGSAHDALQPQSVPDGGTSIPHSRAFKARLRTAWERWMTEGEHTFTKTGRQRRAAYTTICQWIVKTWADRSVSTVVRAFRKAGIVTEMPDNTSETDPDDDFDEMEPAMLDAVFAQLFNSDTEEEEFEGFLDEE